MNTASDVLDSDGTAASAATTLYSKTAPYDESRIRDLWRALLLQSETGRLPEPDSFPVSIPGHHPIARFRDMLIDDEIGLGMQFRWNLIVCTLKNHFLERCRQRERFGAPEVLVQEFLKGAGFPPWFKQLGNVGLAADAPSERQRERAEKVKVDSYGTAALDEACRLLNSFFGDRYRQVASSFKMSPDKLKKRHFGEAAVDEFVTLITTGVTALVANPEQALMLQKRTYFESETRKEMENVLVSRLSRENEGRSIQCIVAPGAPTGLEALAVHLSETLPDLLASSLRSSEYSGNPPARNIFVIPCGRWIAPVAFRGMEYLVHNFLALLRDEAPAVVAPEMSETQLHAGITEIRQALAHRSLIAIFVGLDATPEVLPNLRRAVCDSPLAEFLAYLSQPTQPDKESIDNPVDIKFFDWSYFLVLGTTELGALQEYQQPSLTLDALAVKDLPTVLRESDFKNTAEACSVIPDLLWAPTESALAVFEQICRIEQGVTGQVDREPRISQIGDFEGFGAMVGRLAELLDGCCDPQTRGFLALLAFSISGMRRATLMRCLSFFESEGIAEPGDPLASKFGNFPSTSDEWSKFFETTLERFAPLIRLGPDEKWTDLDPHRHPFEYPNNELLAIDSNAQDWWTESIDFLHPDVQDRLAVALLELRPTLALRCHQIIQEEAYRQHTLVLRHSVKSSRTTLRSYRRGLESLYHGLVCLPLMVELTTDASGRHQAFNLFHFLYRGLFDLLLGPKSHESSRTEWGAELIRFEVAMYVQERIFPLFAQSDLPQLSDYRCDSSFDLPGRQCLSEPDLVRHYISLGVAAFRCGPSSTWRTIRPTLNRFDDLMKGKSVIGKVLVQIDGLSYGPTSERSSGECLKLLRSYSILPQLFEFHDTPRKPADSWLPTFDQLNERVESVVDSIDLKINDSTDDVFSHLVLLGIFRSAAAESKDTENMAMAQLLGYTVPFLAAFELLNRLPGGASVARPPYLAAEGLRMFGRLGLEIIRILQKPSRATHPAAKALVLDLTGKIRRALDYYAQQFHENENERAHMLLLESRFARIAYRGNGKNMLAVQKVPAASTIRCVTAVQFPGAVRRYQIALGFVGEAELSLLRTHPSDSLTIRFLTERCSVMQGLSWALLRDARASEKADAELRPRAKKFADFARRDVVLLQNIIARLKQSEVGILSHAGKTRWDVIVRRLAETNNALLRDCDSATA